ncbi:unnamed protein product, partial [Closterium sp. Yama58-4]
MSRMRRNVVFLSPTPPPSRVKRSFELQVELSEKKLSSISSGFSRICQPQLPNRKFPAAAGDSLVFCKQYPARNPSKCPAVQPMSSLNVARLKGRWYEVAASSAHKFTAELGAACTAFEFEVAPKQNGLNAMRVTRRLVEAVGPVRATQVGTIASASLRSARNLRGVCSAIAGQKLPTELSYASLVNQAKLGLPAAGLDGKTAGQTSTSLSVISASLGQISAQAGAIHARLARIQTDLAPVNQVDRLPSLSALRSRIGNTTEAIRRSVRAIQRSRGRILKQADAVGRYERAGVFCVQEEPTPATERHARPAASGFRRGHSSRLRSQDRPPLLPRHSRRRHALRVARQPHPGREHARHAGAGQAGRRQHCNEVWRGCCCEILGRACHAGIRFGCAVWVLCGEPSQARSHGRT